MLLLQIRSRCKEVGDPLTAKEQQRYMKFTMPYWGVKTPELQKICRTAFNDHPPKDNIEYCQSIRRFFVEASHREEWYAGVRYARHFDHFIRKDNVHLYLEIIRITEWWDVVDSVAQNLVGKALLGSPNLSSILEKWIQDKNMWIRRTALLTQLKYKDQADFNLLKELIQSTWHEIDFFIRKAIGWALRQYSYTNPNAVEEFISENENDLSPLTVREGIRGGY